MTNPFLFLLLALLVLALITLVALHLRLREQIRWLREDLTTEYERSNTLLGHLIATERTVANLKREIVRQKAGLQP